jgi:hypothetical protein
MVYGNAGNQVRDKSTRPDWSPSAGSEHHCHSPEMGTAEMRSVIGRVCSPE